MMRQISRIIVFIVNVAIIVVKNSVTIICDSYGAVDNADHYAQQHRHDRHHQEHLQHQQSIVTVVGAPFGLLGSCCCQRNVILIISGIALLIVVALAIINIAQHAFRPLSITTASASASHSLLMLSWRVAMCLCCINIRISY